jgi:peptidoglycan/LPS O-acetylase OafA/YrhL
MDPTSLACPDTPSFLGHADGSLHSETSQRLAYLDGIRGLASLGVSLWHLNVYVSRRNFDFQAEGGLPSFI